MQQKYELGTRLTYFWHQNEKKISLSFIVVFESLRCWHTCLSFLLSNFTSQIKLIQSVVGSVASHRVPRPPLPWSRVSGSHVPRSQVARPRVTVLEYQGHKSHGPRVPGRRVSGLTVLCLRSQDPGLRVSDPDFRLCLLCKVIKIT